MACPTKEHFESKFRRKYSNNQGKVGKSVIPCRIAVLITCYNRRETTLSCLRALYGQSDCAEVQLDSFLVDDRCTDGTGEAVRRQYPQVNVLQGDGNLFWGGGMRLAFMEAFKGDYDYYLWLNDDTMLFPDSIKKLLDCSRTLRKQNGHEVIVSGSTRDPETDEHTYGGVVQPSRLNPMKFVLVEPKNEPRLCNTIHGNCVLIPNEVAYQVGNLSPDFSHGLGDFDYGLRARDFGISCWLAPGYVGTCAGHEIRGSQFDPTLPANKRLEKMHSPSGLPPTREWLVFTKRHAGILWPISWFRTLIRICFPRLWLLLRSKSVK
jgi:GT2 family glycosyltransferase